MVLPNDLLPSVGESGCYLVCWLKYTPLKRGESDINSVRP